MKRLQAEHVIAIQLVFTALVLYFGCTTHAAPVPPPPVVAYACSIRPIQVMSVQGLDANGNPIEGPAMSLNAAICECSDGIVRSCGK